MALSLKQVQDVCFLNGGSDQCRYLDEDFDDNGLVINVCKKLSPYRTIIDEEFDEFMESMQKSGQKPEDQGKAIGDNCSGYIVLKSKIQGYDC